MLHFRPYFSPPFSRRITVSVSSLSFSFSFSLFSPRRAMSKQPPSSAFHALMSGARAAASKKIKQSLTSPSPKKRKSPHQPPAQNPNNLKTPETVTTVQPSNKPQETVKAEPPKKIPKTSITAELKEWVSQLKNKPSDFDPNSVACWEKNKLVPFLFFCLAFDMIADETGRIVMTDIVCNMLRTVIHATPEDLVPVVYLSANRIAPAPLQKKEHITAVYLQPLV